MSDTEIIVGDCREVLRSLPDESVNCVVTSPPYWGLRDYGTAKWEGGDPACDHKNARADGVVDDRAQRSRDGAGSLGGDCKKCGAVRVDSQIGLETTPDAYVAELVVIFREVRRVLRSDGTVWLNLGDSYSSGGRTTQVAPTLRAKGHDAASGKQEYLNNFAVRPGAVAGIKQKDLIGIPWRVAFALQADGWTLRQDIIWAKPNPMPESVADRCTRSHEYLFLLSKSAKYHFDAAAIAEPTTQPHGKAKLTCQHKRAHLQNLAGSTLGTNHGSETRNKRDVWFIAPKPFKGAHFATFPPELVEPCILAGCPEGGVVLDPFGGAGTTGLVAERLNRNAILIELNPAYAEMAAERINAVEKAA